MLPLGRSNISDLLYGACDGMIFVGGAMVLSVPRHATTDMTLLSGNNCWSDRSMEWSCSKMRPRPGEPFCGYLALIAEVLPWLVLSFAFHATVYVSPHPLTWEQVQQVRIWDTQVYSLVCLELWEFSWLLTLIHTQSAEWTPPSGLPAN